MNPFLHGCMKTPRFPPFRGLGFVPCFGDWLPGLVTICNMPIKRYFDYLQKKGPAWGVEGDSYRWLFTISFYQQQVVGRYIWLERFWEFSEFKKKKRCFLHSIKPHIFFTPVRPTGSQTWNKILLSYTKRNSISHRFIDGSRAEIVTVTALSWTWSFMVYDCEILWKSSLQPCFFYRMFHGDRCLLGSTHFLKSFVN